jgi:hypothetical protein
MTNTKSITAHALDAIEALDMRISTANALRRVGMVKIAEEIDRIHGLVHDELEPIPNMVMADLDKQINHGKAVMGGFVDAFVALGKNERL